MLDTEPQVEEQHEEVAVEVVDEIVDVPNGSEGYEDSEGDEQKTVPLRAVQKERRKRQEAEAESHRRAVELEFYKSQLNKTETVQEDESEYETASRKELRDTASQTGENVKRDLREEIWAETYEAKAEWVDANLANFLKQRPNLTTAINGSKNRYKEAYELMTALSPKEQARLTEKPKRKDAPNTPNSIPKAAGVNQAMNLMDMSDSDFNEWRKTQRKKR